MSVDGDAAEKDIEKFVSLTLGGYRFHGYSPFCTSSFFLVSFHFIHILPVRFSISTSEMMAPKSILEPSGATSGVTTADELIFSFMIVIVGPEGRIEVGSGLCLGWLRTWWYLCFVFIFFRKLIE